MERAKILILFVLLACNFILISGKESDVVAEDISASRQSGQVEEYWTEERMRAAIPHDIIHEGRPQSAEFSGSSHFERTSTEQVYGEGKDSIFFPSEIDENEANDTTIKGQSKRAYPYPYTSGYAPNYNTFPWRAVGKVFFTIPGVGDRVCSAAVIRKFMVQTAGHCVYDNNNWVTNFIFVPGYNNGNRPYGTFSRYQLFTSADWFNSHSWCRDWGFAVLNRINTFGVGDYTGYFGYTYNAATNMQWRSLGYPQDPPFTGQWMYYTDSFLGGTGNPYGCTPAHLGIGSDATGGTSGGPWVVGFGVNNYINSVNSWKYTAQPAAIYGPYFDTQWYNDFFTASGITPP